MGNTQPTNQTGRKATAQKFENAKKLGVLSLSEHSLEHLPNELYSPELKKLRTLDLSRNKLASLGKLHTLPELKSLNLDHNQLRAGSLGPVSSMSKLQNLSCANNMLGKSPEPPVAGRVAARHKAPTTPPASTAAEAVPQLPASLRQLNLSHNLLPRIPRHVISSSLTKLEKLDLSQNQLVAVPAEIANLSHLQELVLDHNAIVSLPTAIGTLPKLKVLSLRHNQLHVTSTMFSDKNPQPLPASLFTDTALIDLNLHGNRMTNTQLNQFEGFQEFLDRRQKVKSKTLTNLDVCGLE